MDKTTTKVVVTSAKSLTSQQQESVRQHINTKLSLNANTFSFHFEVDPSIIGGLVFKVEDKLIDTSISKKLEQIKLLLRKKL